MKSNYLACVSAMGAVLALGMPLASHGEDQSEATGTTIGPDAGLCQLIVTRSWGRLGDIHAYSIQTDTWNVGDENLTWQEFTPLHPVMAQNIYRYNSGRIEQIGLSWIKHGFCALQQPGCGDCFVQTGCLDFLGVGCRDPYSANLNGSQVRLGPRSEVNPSTGVFPYPFTLGWQQIGNTIYKRIQVADADINPAFNGGAKFYIEGQIMHQQEATSDRRHNNITYEEVVPTPSTDTYSLGNGFNTAQLLPAVYAWRDNDPTVDVQAVDIPGMPIDGRFHVAHRVFDNGDGTWRYEYAVHNMNSDRAAQGFSVPMGSGAIVTDTFHRDVKYHSGEVYTNEDWVLNVAADSVSWSGMTFASNPNANALRWGTMFNFSVTTNTPPVAGTVTLTLFKPGDVGAVDVPVQVPGPLPVCMGDISGDGHVSVTDLLSVINSWGACDAPPAPCDADIAPPGGDGTVDVSDLLSVINHWGPCP